MSRRRLVDLFCGAGGASAGYYAAGFDVTGVDIAPQPRYPFPFVRADALTFDLSGFDAVHASPPCQPYSAIRHFHPDRAHPELVSQVRARLAGAGVPYVIENVPGAPVRPDVILCGTAFGLAIAGYELRRHRWFELAGFEAFSLPCQHSGGPVMGVYGDHFNDRRRVLGVYGHSGHRNGGRYGNVGNLAQARAIMGIDWMTTRELAQSIPPAYTEYLGTCLSDHLDAISDIGYSGVSPRDREHQK